MKSKKGILGFGILLIVSAVVMFINTSVFSTKGVIKCPPYKSQQVMDTTRDMLYDLGWKPFPLDSRALIVGKVKLGFNAYDQNKKLITFEFDVNLVASSVHIVAEAGSQYTLEEITNELGQRLGESTGSTPLPVDETSPYYTP